MDLSNKCASRVVIKQRENIGKEERQRDTHTERDTKRHTERRRDTKRETQRERDRERGSKHTHSDFSLGDLKGVEVRKLWTRKSQLNETRPQVGQGEAYP